MCREEPVILREAVESVTDGALEQTIDRMSGMCGKRPFPVAVMY